MSDRQTGYLLPPSVDEWLPERHLARYIVEVIEGLDLGRMSRAYRGSGSASYHPRTPRSTFPRNEKNRFTKIVGRSKGSSDRFLARKRSAMLSSRMSRL